VAELQRFSVTKGANKKHRKESPAADPVPATALSASRPDINVVRATIQFATDTGHLQASDQKAASAEADLSERRQLQIPSPTL
jgi:hypothetical protein